MFGSNKLNPFNGYHAPVGAFLTTYGAAIGAGVSVLSAINQYGAQKDAAKAQKQAQETQAKVSALQEQRQRIQATREARIKRAMIEAQTTSQGMGTGTSGYAGGTGSVSSQWAGQIGYSNTIGGLATQVSNYNQQAIDAGSSASMWQQIGGIAQQATPWSKLFGGEIKQYPPKVTIGGG